MGKKLFKPRQHESGTIVTTKTPYGSDSSMMVDLSKYKTISINADEVVCKDDRGFYITKKNRIDSGIADPNRFSNNKSRIVLEEPEKENSSS
jgi:hypothetical protein